MVSVRKWIVPAGVVVAAITSIGVQKRPPAAAFATTAPAQATAPGFNIQVVADKLVAPWSIKFLPDGRVLFTERAGRVRIIKDGALLPEPALVVPDIKAWVKMGLLGIELDPNFASNHFVYLAECYGGEAERDSWVRIVRYVLNGEKLESPTKLLEKIPGYLNHSGGRLACGPDGKLYITTGDADRPSDAQNLSSFSGKILRINPDGSIPSDNPFVNTPNAIPSIWTFGHRNSQGLAFEPKSGKLFAPEHGPTGGDEVNLITRGANYGWPTVSHDRSANGMVSPLIEFSPSIGPADAVFYHGAMFPELEGNLLVGCLRGEAIMRFTLDSSGEIIADVDRLLFQKIGRIREVAVAPDGAIWITTSEVDPPEGRNKENFDQVIRLTRGTDAPLPPADPALHPLGGVALYARYCASCHGQGNAPGPNSSLFDRKWQFGQRDAEIRRSIGEGVTGVDGHAFAGKLSTEEIELVLRFIRVREEIYGPR